MKWNLFEQQPLTMNHFHYGRNIPLAGVCEYDKGVVFYPGGAMTDPYWSGHASYPMEGSKPIFRNGAWYIRDKEHEGQEIEFTLPTPETVAWWEASKQKVTPIAELAEYARRSWDNYGEDPEDDEEGEE